jgi:hypothetical protein
MSTKLIYYEAYDVGLNVADVNWHAQYFVPDKAITLEYVVLRLGRDHSGVGDHVEVAIQEVDSGFPSGVDLTSGYIDASTLDIGSQANKTIVFSSPLVLEGSKQYALIVRKNAGGGVGVGAKKI